MTRISIGIDFCTTGATVTGTAAGALPRPPPPGGETFDASPPEQPTTIRGATATRRPRTRECEARIFDFSETNFKYTGRPDRGP
jgi:hypothetical protein